MQTTTSSSRPNASDLTAELATMARTVAILGTCSLTEWCELAAERLAAPHLRPGNNAAMQMVTKCALEQLVRMGLVREEAGGYAAVAKRPWKRA